MIPSSCFDWIESSMNEDQIISEMATPNIKNPNLYDVDAQVFGYSCIIFGPCLNICIQNLFYVKFWHDLGNDFKHMVTNWVTISRTWSRFGNKLGNEFGNDLDTTIGD